MPTKEDFDPLGPASRNPKAPPPVAKHGMGAKFANAFKRQTAEEKEAKRREKEKRMNREIGKSAYNSSRMDVIDRLDLSGLNGSLFHHDSPYDACSPHNNRNSKKAPVMAFDPNIDPMTGAPINRGGASNARAGNRPGLSPLAAATRRKMNGNAGELDDGKDAGLNSRTTTSSSNPNRRSQTAPLPLLNIDDTTSQATPSELDGTDASVASHSSVDRDVDAERAYHNQGYFHQASTTNKGRADAANPHADIWGVSSEPWQDFAQPASRNNLGAPSGGSGPASAASSVFDMEAVLTGKAPADAKIEDMGVGERAMGDNNHNGPKRSKSLIKRIKSARQYGNVPPPDDDVVEMSGMSSTQSAARAAAQRHNNRQHRHSPSVPQPPSMPRAHDGNLGRSGTLRAGSGNGASPRLDEDEYENIPSATQSYDDPAFASSAARSGGSSPGSPGAANMSRSGSIFGRFGRRNTNTNGGGTSPNGHGRSAKSRERESAALGMAR